MNSENVEKENIHFFLNKEYYENVYTHNFIFGKKRCGVIYAAMVENITEDLLYYLTEVDVTSGEKNKRLRFRPNDVQWYNICCASTTSFQLCTEAYLKQVMKKLHKNAGEAFEIILSEYLKGEQTEKNLSFDLGGDIIIDGVHWQAKFYNATVTAEKKIQNAKKRKLQKK